MFFGIKFVSNTIQVHIVAYDSTADSYKFLALKRSRSNPLYPFLWQAVTGNIEGDETAIEATIREVREETGLIPKEIWTIPFVATFFDPYLNSVCGSPVFGVLVDYVDNITLSSEHEDYRWLSLDNFVDLVPLPSHKIGAHYFWDYILSKDDKSMFKYEGKI